MCVRYYFLAWCQRALQVPPPWYWYKARSNFDCCTKSDELYYTRRKPFCLLFVVCTAEIGHVLLSDDCDAIIIYDWREKSWTSDGSNDETTGHGDSMMVFVRDRTLLVFLSAILIELWGRMRREVWFCFLFLVPSPSLHDGKKGAVNESFTIGKRQLNSFSSDLPQRTDVLRMCVLVFGLSPSIRRIE